MASSYSSKSTMSMSNENNPHEAMPFKPNPPPRTPLTTIPDPAQTFDSESPRRTSRRSKRASTLGNLQLVANSELPAAEFELEENSSFWADHNVQVMIRVRPPSAMEKVAQGFGRCLRQESGHSLVWLGHPETRFIFDHVACETVSQEKVFQVAGVPMVENCLSGYNSCMFAYGQTGSGKTYTMMGEISEIQGNRSGLTPRIFQYLFKRIVAEEESRRDERLVYICKCSFLEIYNEQITDLLEPSSNNLQLREDVKKGVHVENLTEYVVMNVNDVVQLLLQGAANRKVAATHMNRESSRSHSVFTCTIESRWENDSMSHFRFARLNLVDLAGSERQKSSGAEGDRLKEAANINKSLSTLGLVIMSLVDLAHGKHRHVPYRDSRLTFLLQDSLGGNSKTTIIANISPSQCSSNETLSTLKFAQRAKLIQNNAKVNEDTSGDTNALQRQIQELKSQLSSLMGHVPSPVPSTSESRFVDLPGEYDNNIIQHFQNKLKHMEAILVGALRREKLAERAVLNLEAELGHTYRSARQREEEAQHSKMIPQFRKEEIEQLELPKDGFLSAENKALLEESQLLQAGIGKMPVLNQYALENIRLKEQLQQYQNFYKLGEREILIAELAELRNLLQDMLEDKAKLSCNKDMIEELEDCKVMNSKLIRKVEELSLELRNSPSQSAVTHSFKDSQVFRRVDDYALLESRSMQSDARDEIASHIQEKDIDNVSGDEFMDATGSLMEVEPQHCSEDTLQRHSLPKPENGIRKHGDLDRLNSLTKDLRELRLLNSQIQEELELQVSCQHEADIVREQVETETARTILQFQEEVSTLEGNLDEKLGYMTRENTKLRSIVAAKDEEVNTLNAKWERAIAELTEFLVDGFRSLRSVSSQIQSIACAFPKSNVSISEHVERAARVLIEKEETILQLKRNLEDAQIMVEDMSQKLCSLRRVTMALTDVDADDEISEEHISLMLNDKIDMVKMFKLKEARAIEAEKSAYVAFIVMNWLFDGKNISQNESESTIPIPSQYHLLHQIKDEVAETNIRLKVIEDFLCTEVNIFECSSSNGDASSPDSSSSSSERLKDLILPSLHWPLESLYASSESSSDKVRSFLKMEFEVLFDAFNKIHFRLASVIDEFNSRQTPEQENDLKHIEKFDHGESFLKKFEEAGLTIKEAALMLNALVQANENSKQLSVMWKRTGEELMIERANLVEEVECLKLSLFAKENENQLLHDQASWSLQDLESSISLLEESYQELECGREKLTTVYSDILSMGMELGKFVHYTKSLPEDICLKIMERDFFSFVLHQSYVEALLKNNPCQDAECGRCLFGDEGILQNGGKMIMIADGKPVDDCESLALKKELKRKEQLLDGLLFDFSLLQESTSITKDNKDETEKLECTLSRVRLELDEKTRHVDELLVQHTKLESRLANFEDALTISKSNFSHANKTVDTYSEQNAELKGLVNDLYFKNSEVEKQLEEQKEIVRSLEEEILQLGSSTEMKYILLIEDVECKLKQVTGERDRIKKKAQELNDKLEMAYALIDEKEAIIVESRQESKESKIYAEQKEEEVKILEHSIEELDSTVNVLENKVFEMDADVERNRLIRDSLELELDILRQRMLAVENFSESVDSENKDDDQISRPLQNKDIELHKARARITFLEEERAEHDNEIKQYKEYVNELMVHAEAQASQYQQKYKTLEAMVREVKADSVAVVEKSTARSRGSNSPFRCIGGLRDQELSAAKLRIEELETLTVARHKEVCMLNTRLAGAENMTHDVIRDLLGVKLDMTNFANMIDQTQVHQFMDDARQQIEEILAKEQEIFSLRKQLDDANEERESYELGISKRDEDLFAARIAIEQLEERDRLLSVQNKMLQMDTRNLKKKIAELDEMVKALLGTREQGHRRSLHKKPMTIDNAHFSKRLEQSEKLLSRVNGELAQYYKSPHGDGSGTSYRKQKGQLR